MVILSKVPRHHPSYFKENSESLALGYLVAYLRIHGHKVIMFDGSLEYLSPEEAKWKLLKMAKESKPILIGFTIADMTFVESSIEVIKYLKENGVTAHMVMGGHAPTFNYKEIFKICPELDSIVRYEGEQALLHLVNAIISGNDWRRLPNIVYKNNGKLIANPPLPPIENLDELPFPSRDYLPFILSNIKDIGIVPVATSRGCYMNCGFCSIRGFYGALRGKLWRTRSIKNTIQEMKTLKRQFPGIKEIVIIDDIFTGLPQYKIERMLEFKDELQKNSFRLMFSISDRPDVIDEGLGKIWRDIGVRQVLLGLESGSQDILNKFNKNLVLDDHKKALKILEKYDIDTAISYINFTPWSTLEQIKENVKYFLSLKINMIQGMLNRFQVYDGTPLGEELKQQGLVYGEFPYKSYRTLDERVDRLYEIVNKSFNAYLFIAYRLKILEREIRITLFDTENAGDYGLVNQVRKYKLMYKDMMQKIMEEAVSQFLEIIEFVKEGKKIDNGINSEIKERVLRNSNEWLRMIELFRALCPVLNGKRGDGYGG